MDEREKSATVDLKVRMKEPLRARIEAAAKERGVSMNAEAVDRLERSFATDDQHGSPQVANMARMMVSAFVAGGQMAAAEDGRPWSAPAEWIFDAAAYEAAAGQVLYMLAMFHPDPHIGRARLRRTMAAIASRARIIAEQRAEAREAANG